MEYIKYTRSGNYCAVLLKLFSGIHKHLGSNNASHTFRHRVNRPSTIYAILYTSWKSRKRWLTITYILDSLYIPFYYYNPTTRWITPKCVVHLYISTSLVSNPTQNPHEKQKNRVLPATKKTCACAWRQTRIYIYIYIQHIIRTKLACFHTRAFHASIAVKAHALNFYIYICNAAIEAYLSERGRIARALFCFAAIKQCARTFDSDSFNLVWLLYIYIHYIHSFYFSLLARE